MQKNKTKRNDTFYEGIRLNHGHDVIAINGNDKMIISVLDRSDDATLSVNNCSLLPNCDLYLSFLFSSVPYKLVLCMQSLHLDVEHSRTKIVLSRHYTYASPVVTLTIRTSEYRNKRHCRNNGIRIVPSIFRYTCELRNYLFFVENEISASNGMPYGIL